ncbi:MAG: hypothetical protein GSR84_04825 [Desulfurococcales archaeon]|nr:hypothetical protein [Desulfurococcales archaeon]
MDNASDDSRLEKLILVAGLTGVGLRQAYQWLKNNAGQIEGLREDCIVHFEDKLLSRMHRPCVGIEQVAGLVPISRDSGRSLFEETATDLLQGLASRGCRTAVIFIHLSYLSHGTVITNPALGRLLSSSHRLYIVYLIDDFYDALVRIKRRLQRRLGSMGLDDGRMGLVGSPFTIDPMEYLTWRAIDYNLITALETFKPGTRTFLFGVKHPLETFRRLINSLANDDTRYVYAYASHTITVPRRLYSLGHTQSIRDNPIVLAIEAFKEALLEADKCLILFEPTSVDELLSDNAKNLLEKLTICDNHKCNKHQESHTMKKCTTSCLESIKERICSNLDKEQREECNKRLEGLIRKIIINHSLIVTSNNKWPLHASTLYEAASNSEGCMSHKGAGNLDYCYPYRRDDITLNIVDPDFSILYGGTEQYAKLLSIIKFEIEFEIESFILRLNSDNAQDQNAGRSDRIVEKAILEKLISQIKRQIEMRDYHYVSQSSTIAVVMPLIVATHEDLKKLGKKEAKDAAGVYYPRSSGVEAEMQRAIALAKPIIVFILPISVTALAKPPGKNKAKNESASNTNENPRSVINILGDKNMFIKCLDLPDNSSTKNINITIIRNCTKNLKGLFTPSSAGVRYCLIPYILTSENLKGDYYTNLNALKEKYLKELLARFQAPLSPSSCTTIKS